MQLYSYRRTKDIYRHLASYEPASLSLFSIRHIRYQAYIHTYIQPSSHIALLLPYLKSDYLTYCNPSCCPQDKSQANKPTVCYITCRQGCPHQVPNSFKFSFHTSLSFGQKTVQNFRVGIFGSAK